MLQRALTAKEQTHGKGHISTADTILVMANILIDQAKYSDAQRALQRALLIKEKTHGEGHISTFYTIHTQCHAFIGLGEYDQALSMGQRALSIAEKTYGEGGNDGFNSYSWVTTFDHGMVNDGKGNHAAALRCYTQAAETAKAASSSSTMGLTGKISITGKLWVLPLLSAVTHTALGNTDEAASCVAAAMATLKKIADNMTPALSLLQVVLSGKEAAYGREHASCAPVLLVMAQMHDADSNTDKATELRRRNRDYPTLRSPDTDTPPSAVDWCLCCVAFFVLCEIRIPCLIIAPRMNCGYSAVDRPLAYI
jgi:tetratricopeptide (TPR) repeat protein